MAEVLVEFHCPGVDGVGYPHAPRLEQLIRERIDVHATITADAAGTNLLAHLVVLGLRDWLDATDSRAHVMEVDGSIEHWSRATVRVTFAPKCRNCGVRVDSDTAAYAMRMTSGGPACVLCMNACAFDVEDALSGVANG